MLSESIKWTTVSIQGIGVRNSWLQEGIKGSGR